jgi:serine/threonine protein kinase
LAHAHENGIVHRDIKPSNILLTKKAEPKIADFGLAHATDSAESGLMMGTPGYTAPEVFHDPSQAGKLADIYSVGVILHQLLTGIDPAGSFEPPSKPTGSLRLDEIYRKATHIMPAQRHKSIHALASDLETWASAPKAPQKPAIPAGPVARPPQKQPVKSAKSSGGGVIVKFLVIGILLAAGVYAYRFLQDNKEKPKQGIAVIKETGASDPADTTHVNTVPTPIPNPPKKVKDEPIPEPVIANTGTKKEQKLPPVVNKEPEPKPDKELPPGDPELRNRAIGLIIDARKKRDKEFADNARSMVSKLDSSARSAKKGESASIERLKKDIVDDRIPLTEGVNGLPDGLANSFKAARTKESSILEGYSTALTRIRDAYVTRLQGAATETVENELKSRLLAQAGSAKDLNTWVAQLSPETEKVPKKSAIVFGSGNFAGKWKQLSDGGSVDLIWIAHSDGELEVEGKPWKGTWKIEDNGTLVVTWPDKPRPYVYNRDGNGWDGKTSFGQPSKLTPAGS